MELNKDKQIEKMAKVIGDADQRCYEMDCDDCPLHDTELGLCKEKFNATELYNAGYRKASDVAREIFEEIEEGIKSAIAALQFSSDLSLYRKAKHDAYSSTLCFIKTLEERFLGEIDE